MDVGVGKTLREARTRRRVDLAEVEAATKIRSRYLRAIENEEWDQLPGDTYARAFIRAYAGHLGLDGERLAEEHRRDRGAARPGERLPKVDPVRPKPRRRSPSRQLPNVSPRLLAAVVSALLVVVAVAVGLSSGGGSQAPVGSSGKSNRHGAGKNPGEGAGAPAPSTQPSGHVVRLTADAEVWVCLLGASGKPLIDGQILAAGSSEGPYRSGSFTVSLGNGEVTMTVDGQQASIPATSSPVGYSIGGGELRQLSEGERPTCT
jgi:cytoskeleton protein RodZ